MDYSNYKGAGPAPAADGMPTKQLLLEQRAELVHRCLELEAALSGLARGANISQRERARYLGLVRRPYPKRR